jgi:UDP-glucose 4-epimerase
MDWLITGGCGFLGTSLVRALYREGGHRVRVLDDLSVGSLSALEEAAPVTEPTAAGLVGEWTPKAVQFVRGDIRDARLGPLVARGCQVIVHLAANAGVERSMQDPRGDCGTNVLGTLHYLEAARRAGVRRFVFASSSASVGEVEPPIHEELPARPVSPYGAGKLAGEAYCTAYHRAFGIETVALRFGNVYGPGSSHKTSVVAEFIRRALCGQPLEIYGDGEQTRDFLYVGDLVRAVRCAATASGVGGEIFQIASGREMTIGELAAELLPILARHGVSGVSVHCSAPRAGDVRRSYADTTKARWRLQWRVEVPVAEGLERTLAWFQTQGPARAVMAVGGAR